MATFEYQAYNHKKELIQGEVIASSFREARKVIRTRGYFPIKLKNKGEITFITIVEGGFFALIYLAHCIISFIAGFFLQGWDREMFPNLSDTKKNMILRMGLLIVLSIIFFLMYLLLHLPILLKS